MPRDWEILCKECLTPFRYSERSRVDAHARGQSPPERCQPCRTLHSRAISRLAVKYLDLEPGLAVPSTGLKAGRLGRLHRPERAHDEVPTDGFVPLPPDTFGIQDEEIAELLTELGDKQVAVIVAGTGSGKSTFLPYRLMVPPDPFPEDYLTRYGKIVVTQPRIEASTGIPQYVAEKLHASTAGPGTDIGYQNSKNRDKSDSRNKLVYLTDGTLVNMIRRGALHEVSAVVIDEAHERSLNIDLILALLRRELCGLPHLKVLVVSATIETETFRNFFEPDFPVVVKTMQSKGIYPVHERWWSGPELPTPAWPSGMPDRAAETVVEILRWMILGDHPTDIPSEVDRYDGDILVFLTGKAPITNAIEATRKLLDTHPDLADAIPTIELLPLYGELPEKQRQRPLDPATRSAKTRYRVIYSTNLAETSLTIDGIRHVVDSGLINRTTWDPTTATEAMEQVPHSQHGLRQRRGRAGRTAPGVWHCLYNEAQFNHLDRDTPPEIVRAPLPVVILAAAVAGVTDPESLTWLAPGPPPTELVRARVALKAIGAIDEDGDPTPLGRELAITQGTFEDAAILVAADQAGCAIEAATVLAARSRECRNLLLRWSTRWPAPAKVHVDDVHEAYLAGAVDDVDVVCRLWSGWEAQPDESARKQWADRVYVDASVMATLGRERRKILEPLMAKTRSSVVRPLDLRLLPRLRAAIAWANPNSVYVAERSESSDQRESVVSELAPYAGARSDVVLVAAMHEGLRPSLDDQSWVSRHLPTGWNHLLLLDRKVRSRYLTPLASPERTLQATFCVVIDIDIIRADDDEWLPVIARIPLAEASSPPSALPGDRFVAEMAEHGSRRLRLVGRLDPLPDPTVEVEVSEDDERISDDSDDTDGLPPADVGGRDAAEAEAQSLVDDEPDGDEADHDDEEREPLTTVADDGPADAAPLLNDLHAVLVEGQEEPGARGETFGVVVRAVTPEGCLVCALDEQEAAFDRFVEIAKAGEVDLVVDDIRVFARDREPVLIAHHPASGFRLPVGPRRIGTGMRYPQLRELQRGTRLSLHLDAASRVRLLPEVSQTPRTLRALSRLASDRTPYRIAGQIVDVFGDAVYLQLIPDGVRLRADDPPIVLKTKDLPQAPERIRLGATVPVILTWGKRFGRTYAMPCLVDTKVPDGPWETWGDELAATGPVTAHDWERLVDLAAEMDNTVDAARFRSQATAMATASTMPRAKVVDDQIFEALTTEGKGLATVVKTSSDGSVVLASVGGEHYIPRREAELFRQAGNELKIGSTVTAHVVSADAELSTFEVRLFDPRERDGVQVGAIVSARLGARTSKGGERHVATLTGVEGLVPVDTLTDHVDEGDVVDLRVVEAPSEGKFRFSGFTQSATVAVATPVTAWVERDQHGRWALWPFRRLVGSEIEMHWDPSGRLELFSAPQVNIEAAAVPLRDAVAGALLVLTVPHHQPIRADDRRALQEATLETGALLFDGRRTRPDGRFDNVVWIAAPDRARGVRAAELLAAEYPLVWASEWFKRRSDEWEAAKAAVKSLPGRLRTTAGNDYRGKPEFRAIIECSAEDLPRIETAARAAFPGLPSGMFGQDPILAVNDVTRPAPRAPAPSVLPRPAVAPTPVRNTRPPSPSPPRTIVAEGSTVDDAIKLGLSRLGVPKDQVHVEILAEATHSRFLGRLKTPASVRLTTKV